MAIPTEELDHIEKLLDVALNCIEMPHLTAIKQACLDELVQINATMAEAQTAAATEAARRSAEAEADRKAKAAAAARTMERTHA